MRIILFFLSLAFAYSHFSHCSTDIDWQAVDLADATFWQKLTLPSTFTFGVASQANKIEGR